MRFEWDPKKAETNLRKHGVSFEMAVRVFFDPYVLYIQDRVEECELRWQAIGRIDAFTALFVAHSQIDDDGREVIRFAQGDA